MKLWTLRDEIRKDLARDVPFFTRRGDEVALWNKAKTWGQIGRELGALDPETATTAQLDAIIGNKTRGRLACDECEQEVEATVHIGDEPDYEARYQRLCRDCLGAAFRLIPIPGPPAPPPPTRPMRG